MGYAVNADLIEGDPNTLMSMPTFFNTVKHYL